MLYSYIIPFISGFLNENTLSAFSGEELILTTDGSDWTSVTNDGKLSDLEDVEWGSGKYISIGSQGFFAMSHDAKNWTVGTIEVTQVVGSASEQVEVKTLPAVEKTYPLNGGILYLSEQDCAELELKPGFNIVDKRNYADYVAILDPEGNNVFETYGYIGGYQTQYTKNTLGLNIALSGTFESNNKYTVEINEGFLEDDFGNVNQPYSFTFTVLESPDSDMPVSEQNTNNSQSRFSDVPQNHWAFNAIDAMYTKGIISGYPDKSFKPNNYVTRSEFAKMMTLALNLQTSEPNTPSFKDVGRHSWDYKYVETVKSYMTGYHVNGGKYFKGSETAIREEVAAALVRALHLENQDLGELKGTIIFKDYYDINFTLTELVLIAYKNNIISGYEDGTFRPMGKLTRAEAAVMLFRLIEKNN